MMSEDFRAFARQAVRRIAEDLRDCGADALERRARELLYRAFDPLDEVFELRYELDTGMKAADSRERHFEGTGLGVQTSYASILKLLPKLGLGAGARLIDLGSGYGRVGLMTGLWREDLQFTGYELVAHRVRSANASAVRAGLAPRVEFIAQDLAARDFLIPAAEAYYLYDPFCAETYRHVLGQLARFGRERAITVITKADARRWFLDFVADAGWSEPEPCDENTLWLFRSRPVLVASGVLSV